MNPPLFLGGATRTRSRVEGTFQPRVRVRLAMTPLNGMRERLLPELSAELDRLGLDVEPVQHEVGQTEGVDIVDIVVRGWAADYPDPGAIVEVFEDPTLAAFLGSQPSIERLVREGRLEPDAARRRAIYMELEEVAADLALVVPLYHEGKHIFVRPEVIGLDEVTIGATRGVDYAAIRVEATAVRG